MTWYLFSFRTYGNLTCDLYSNTGDCSPVLTGLIVVNNHSRLGQSQTAEDVTKIFSVLRMLKPSLQCLAHAHPLLCRYAFPTCDPAFSIPVYQPLCRWDCQIIRDFICSDEWKTMLRFENTIHLGVIDRFDCDKLSSPNAGQAPMCISTQDGGWQI